MRFTEFISENKKPGLWANIHAKRDRIKNGSGEHMRKPGSKGAPTADALKKSATDEAANPAQQAAKAIAMKKAGKKPKKVTEYVDHNLIQKWNEYNLSIIDKVKKLGDMLYSTTDYKNKIDFDDIDYEDMGISKEKFQKHINQYIHKQQLTLLNFWHEKKELELNTELTLDDKIEEVHQLYNDLLTDLKKLGFPVSVLKDKEDTEGVAEGVNSYLWHGSRHENKVLVPRQANDTGGKEESNKNAVYATPSAKVAIAMGLTTPGSDTGMFPNDPQMVLFKGQIRKGQMVYLHKVPKDLFIKHNSREWFSKPGVKEITPMEVVAVPVDNYLNLIRQATPQDLELQKKYMKQSVAAGSLNELSSGLLQKAAQAATDKRNQAMEPELHNALGGGYMNPLATHYDNVSQKMDNRAAQVKRKETIKNIASQIASPAVMRKMKMSGVAEDRENFNGINLLLQKDDDEVFVKASAGSRELGHVLFVMDGDYLMPQDLEVEERYRGQGIAQTMYDFVKSKGYKIRRSGQQTDAGAGFWAKHRPEQNVWEEGVAEGMRKWLVIHSGSHGEGGKMIIKAPDFDTAWKLANEYDLDIIEVKPVKGVAEGAEEDMSKEAKAMATGKCPHCHGPVQKKEHPTLTQYHCAKCGIRGSIDKQSVAEGYNDLDREYGGAYVKGRSDDARMTEKLTRQAKAAAAKAGKTFSTSAEYRMWHMKQKEKQGVAEGAPELLKQEMPLVRHIEQELAQHGYEKGTPEYDQMFKHTMSMYRKFGNVDAIKRGVAEAIRPDVMRHQGDKTIKIVKRAGKPIGEIGIDAEASSGIGSYYVKMYDGSYDAVGFDTAEEALAELKDIIKQTMAEGENWSKHNNKRAGGMSKKSVSVYRREHPGSKIQTAVTTKPSKLKKGSKAAKRRASFCARMRGMKKHRTGAKTARDPNSNINKSLRRWHCESIEELHELVMLAEQYIRNNKK